MEVAFWNVSASAVLRCRVAVDLSNFSNPWEHVRLLSDGARNQALIQVLERRAPGARVLEVGCGTGLLSCIAARLGATEVYAVEPTHLVEEAHRMIEANGLEGVVHVIQGRVQDVAPRPVDFVFSELLNADPFVEGVLEAMRSAEEWLVPGGLRCPRRLAVYIAGIDEASAALEVMDARREVDRYARAYDLDLARLDRLLASPGPSSSVQRVDRLATAAMKLWDIEVGVDERPSGPVTVDLRAERAGPISAAVVWFEAELDDGLVMHNRPGVESHWGQLVSSWSSEQALDLGELLRVTASVDDEGMWVEVG